MQPRKMDVFRVGTYAFLSTYNNECPHRMKVPVYLMKVLYKYHYDYQPLEYIEDSTYLHGNKSDHN